MRVVVVGGGIAGLVAARRLEAAIPDVEVVLLERERRLGGKLLTEHVAGLVIEGAADSFLSRKERGIGLCEELGLDEELVGRRPENARSFVRVGRELHPLPEGLTGMIPADVEALERTTLLSEDGRKRLAAEADLEPAPPGGDESIASFVSRRLGKEAYERLVEPLLTGIYGGDGEQLSLQATFPNLRRLELEHGGVLRGLAGEPSRERGRPAFVSLRGGMDRLIAALEAGLERTHIRAGAAATSVRRGAGRYVVEAEGVVHADGVIVAAPAFAASEMLVELDPELADLLSGIPYASSAIVTLAYGREDIQHPLDGYGYVVPRIEGSDVMACTWTSSKWEGRAPESVALLRVYAGRFGSQDVTAGSDDELIALARDELRLLGIEAEPALSRVHRWPRGMPQYVLGHPERLDRIDARLADHPGIALAGAAYRGVGIPDCIASGEAAAESVVESLAAVR